LSPFFATADLCQEFVSEPYPKYELKAPPDWAELIKTAYADGKCRMKALRHKSDATLLNPSQINAEQISKTKGG
jgi:hypothetical protein